MRLQHRVEEINFEHEKRISELEMENNILKNEMNKLRHLYTRSELDEQVQRAEFEWMETLNQQQAEAPAETDQPETPAAQQQPPIRRVPPQDSGVKRKVVWSGDEEEPMLIVDKDYILPAFCYNQDQAVQDDLFFEYSAKYCDVRKRKIEAKQKKSEFEAKRQPKKENYNKFIQQVPTDTAEDGASFGPGKMASPFNIDYKKAFDAIKSEGSVIVEALGNILDLSPDPEEIFKSKVVDTPKPIEEASSLSEKPIENDPNGKSSNQRMERENSEENFHKNGKKDHQNDWKGDDRHHEKNSQKESHKFQKSSQKQPSQQLRQENYFPKHSQGEGANNGDSNEEREDAHHKLHFDARYKEYDQKFNGAPQEGSGKRQKPHHSSAGSSEYDQKFSGDQESSGKRQKTDHFSEDSPKHHKQYYDQQKHSEWAEKRYKGREEYRQKGEQKDGEWHDKRPKGREEYRRKDAQQPGEWHYKRYKGREAYRQNSEQNSGEWHDKRHKGREEYRQYGDRHGHRKGSEERKWHD
ncbi:hypothetical protein ZHAS_00011582 [Anopheles sinensis]|uniref:Uncharacterized protein n=1 Tax=Anopheles sinensis TaxID=74873 RepID=A0A084W095_ANOSI|nr:hypothetical protein ZHAS_00011582 [Anopheles sinensis]